MGILFWRRVSRLGMSSSWPNVPAGQDLHRVPRQGRAPRPPAPADPRDDPEPHLLAGTRRASIPPRFGAADSAPDAGLSAKYGVTSAVTLEGTFNPDFSQVESDAFQVEVNQRYPLFFSEKRPFFMEGMGTFELAGAGGDSVMRTAVNTRTIADPRWGGKVTGTLGRLTFATLSAGDEAPGRPTDDGPSPFPGDRKLFNIGRAGLQPGPQQLRGGARHRHRVRPRVQPRGRRSTCRCAGASSSWSATGLATTSRSPEGDQDTSGVGGQASYAYESKRLLLREPARALRTRLPDGHRVPEPDGHHGRLGLRRGELLPRREEAPVVEARRPLRLLPRARDEIQGGNGWFVLPGLRMHFTRQGFFRIDTGWGQEPWAQQVFETRTTRVIGQAQFTRWLNLYVELPVRPLDLLRPDRPRSSAARARCPLTRRSSRARASTSPCPGTTSPSTASPGSRVYDGGRPQLEDELPVRPPLPGCARSSSTTARAGRS